MTGMSRQYTVHSEQHRTPTRKPLPPRMKESLPEMFRDADTSPPWVAAIPIKIDLNLANFPTRQYLGNDWGQAKPGQPFFAHLTLLGTHRPWRGDRTTGSTPPRSAFPPGIPTGR